MSFTTYSPDNRDMTRQSYRIQHTAPSELQDTFLDKVKRSLYKSICWEAQQDSQTNMRCPEDRARSKKQEFSADFSYPKMKLSERRPLKDENYFNNKYDRYNVKREDRKCTPSRLEKHQVIDKGSSRHNAGGKEYAFTKKLRHSECHTSSYRQHNVEKYAKKEESKQPSKYYIASKNHPELTQRTTSKNREKRKSQNRQELYEGRLKIANNVHSVQTSQLLSKEPSQSRKKSKDKRAEVNEQPRIYSANSRKTEPRKEQQSHSRNRRYQEHCDESNFKYLQKSQVKPLRYGQNIRSNSRMHTKSVYSCCHNTPSYESNTKTQRSHTNERHCKQIYELTKDQCKSFKDKGYIKVNVRVKPNVSVRDFNIIIQKDKSKRTLQRT